MYSESLFCAWSEWLMINAKKIIFLIVSLFQSAGLHQKDFFPSSAAGEGPHCSITRDGFRPIRFGGISHPPAFHPSAIHFPRFLCLYTWCRRNSPCHFSAALSIAFLKTPAWFARYRA